ncbi:MAG: STAS/SEC14 domain-containing protein [Saprospiraceae bacterium]
MSGQASTRIQQLLSGAEQLSDKDLDAFADRVMVLRAGRYTPHLPTRETSLLEIINRGLSADQRLRLEVLNRKRKSGSLSDVEHGALLTLTDLAEQLDAERIEALAELARLRRTTVPALMLQLNLRQAEVDG